ncbi:hypothetical protein VD0004_g3130 [Verticillium dahliae]|nr:hypothetical protein VD0004_g3130 [Verticillium dahliae]PNH75448.1 hypothetical protein VD0001_g2146 [Verticillium dahliae]
MLLVASIPSAHTFPPAQRTCAFDLLFGEAKTTGVSAGEGLDECEDASARARINRMKTD